MVQNAKDAGAVAQPRMFVIGPTGVGKTTQFLTFPGKKFAYIFDPSGLMALRGYDVDYEQYLPENLDLGLTSLSKDKAAAATRYHAKKVDKDAGAKLYQAWEEDFEKKMEEGFFDDYDAIMIDSATTLLDMIMDGILAINGRPGQWPNQDDYGPQMITFTKIVRRLNSLGKLIYMTGHTEMQQDGITHQIVNQPVLTGKLKQKIPLLFSEVLILEAEADKHGNVNWNAQFRPDKRNQAVRSSLRNVRYKEEITLDFDQDLTGQGLAALFATQEVDERKRTRVQS